MPLEPIQPLGPPASRPAAIPAIRRSEGSTEKREGDGSPPPRKRRPAEPDLPPPPDDGRPHIDVRA